MLLDVLGTKAEVLNLQITTEYAEDDTIRYTKFVEWWLNLVDCKDFPGQMKCWSHEFGIFGR
jgi:hypothetical protein